MIILPSGAPAILAKPVPWWDTGWARQIRASIDRHDPAAAALAVRYGVRWVVVETR